jgi:hypothetical protein
MIISELGAAVMAAANHTHPIAECPIEAPNFKIGAGNDRSVDDL